MHTYTWRSSWLLIAPLLMLQACAFTGPPAPLPPVPVQAAKIPPLPATARQPATPDSCLPSCSRQLTSERENWLRSLTVPTPPGASASSVTTH